MKYFFFFFLLFLSLVLPAEPNYEFFGRHLIISYVGCDSTAIHSESLLKEKMIEAAKASGVTILSSSDHHFDPEGMTQVLLLSESHASIHTYPELNSCFVDLFTCGTSFQMDRFDEILAGYLKPKKASYKFLERKEGCEEISFIPKYSDWKIETKL